MIKIKVDYDGDFIKHFTVKGHANYDTYGKDIVCASASSIVITSVNLALEFNDKIITFEEKDGLIDVKIEKYETSINKIFINMINMLKELEKDYSKNIKIM